MTGGDRAGRRLVRLALLIGAPLLAIVVAWRVTRPPPVSQPTSDASVRGATSPVSGDGARTVMLDARALRRIGVTYAPVLLGALGREVRTVGQVSVDETRLRTVSPKVDGWVERLYVDYVGKPVTRGSPLFTLYAPMVVTAQEELLLARRLADTVSGASAETRTSAGDLVASARQRLRWWDVAEQDIARIERTGVVERTVTLYATAGGIVLEKNVTAGQKVMAGDALYRIADLSSVWVDGDVYERDLASLSVGQRAVATFEALPGERLIGRIAYIYPTLSLETRTAKVRITLANARGLLKPGMYATLLMAIDAEQSVLSVPRGALLETGGRNLVFVVRRDGQLEPRQVDIGAASGDRIQILRGVAVGDTVVASATFLIDAESNLGTALGGMGNMPGMDVNSRPVVPTTPAPPSRTAPAASRPRP